MYKRKTGYAVKQWQIQGQKDPADRLYVYYIMNGQENAPSCRGR